MTAETTAPVQGAPEQVVVRQRWDAPGSAAVRPELLRDLHVRNAPGGVCGALPRGFLHGRLWCDQLPPGALGHVCHAGSRPHELLVCILPHDNATALLDRLRAQARR
jgi:hypothetical protein